MPEVKKVPRTERLAALRKYYGDQITAIPINPAQPVLLVDVDGTIAHGARRIKFIRDPANRNWDEFFEQTINDKPRTRLIRMVDTLRKSGMYTVVFLCGRPERYRALTLEWLSKNGLEGVPSDRLIMRFESDCGSDMFWKKRMVRMLQIAGAKRMVALEDRDHVVAMFRARGVFCLQVVEDPALSHPLTEVTGFRTNAGFSARLRYCLGQTDVTRITKTLRTHRSDGSRFDASA